MGFTSILDLKKVPEREGGRPDFFLDLNLNQIIERICALWEKNVSDYYYYLPADRECEDYRRAVFADIKTGGTYEILCDFAKRMQNWREARSKGAVIRNSLQREAWFLAEVCAYCENFVSMEEKLEGQKPGSAGMQSFLEYLKKYLNGERFQSMRKRAGQLQEMLDGFRVRLSYENERMFVAVTRSEGEDKGWLGDDGKEKDWSGENGDGVKAGSGQRSAGKIGAYDFFLQSAFSGSSRKMKSPFEVSPDSSELEMEILKILQKVQPDFFKECKRFYREFAGYEEPVLLQFAEEIEYYLSFRCFELYMQKRGCVFATAKRAENMQACGLYDLALALQKEVVPNDMSYLEGEKFFVLTGPNQGGKTTFARSLGQLVYFAKMGLDVPARSATVPCFGDILTHFSVEESVETGRGKLKEELMRLEPMMTDKRQNAFVIINELFTTAANYDACIMGKRVLHHFLDQKCQGIYVTHLKELAEEYPGIVSLRAMLDENGQQNFEILRSPAVESANAINQVNKYQLTYRQLKARLGSRTP